MVINIKLSPNTDRNQALSDIRAIITKMTGVTPRINMNSVNTMNPGNDFQTLTQRNKRVK